jgi:GT2 family glycosyltransferase
MAKRKTRANPGSDTGQTGRRASGAAKAHDVSERMGAGGDDLSAAVDRHDQALDDLGGQVDWVLARQEWIQSGLYDLNLSLTALTQTNGRRGPRMTEERLAYMESVRAIREVVRRTLPRAATVIVVSKGDDALLDLYGRRAWHFPQASDGDYAGYYLPDGTGLIAHLETLRARGGQYLLLPESSLWWLDAYPKFALHLRRHYPLVMEDPDTCAIFALERYLATDPEAWKVRLAQVIEDFSAEHGEEPSVLDWNTAPNLKQLLPNQAVFSPPMAGSDLPYPEKTADVVVVGSSDDHVLIEARRVARHVVVTLEAAEPATGAGLHEIGPRFTVDVERTDTEARATTASSSIIIPTYDGWKQLDLCLAALDETLQEAFVGEVVVVDDGSKEKTQAVLDRWEAASPRLSLKVVRNESNCGFTESCNRGAAAAEGDILVFLNDDTLPQMGWLSALLRTFREHPNVGAVGGKLVYPDGSLQEAGDVVFNDGTGANFGRGDYCADDPLYSYVREVDYCSAALLATPRQLFEEIGGFDERYSPAYYEDTDYCFAVRKHGLKVVYQPESVVVHTEGATSGTDLTSGVKRYQVVNQSKFVEKWKKELSKQPPPPDRYDLRTWHDLATRAGA